MSVLDADLERHRAALWGLGYRMLGTPAEADDLVQDTLVRALERPPPDTARDLRPWLLRVGTNLARDRLRLRRRRHYHGPWLPGPLEATDELLDGEASFWTGEGAESVEQRLVRAQSLRFSFLLALEALTPTQRAVLVLRDVFELSGAETAAALGTTEAGVKTTLHRARRALGRAGQQAASPRDGVVLARLSRWLECLTCGDLEAALALCHEEVTSLSDGAGEVRAAGRPLRGPEEVIRVHARLVELAGQGARGRLCRLNGEPALVFRLQPVRPGWPQESVLRLELDDDGRIREIHSILAPDKLTGLAP